MITYIKDGIIYQRIGKCKICGKCCNGIFYTTSEHIMKSVNRYENVCCELINNKCNIHNKKNQLCRKYPLTKDETDLFPECGYSWIEIKKTNRENSKIFIRDTKYNKLYYKIKEK